MPQLCDCGVSMNSSKNALESLVFKEDVTGFHHGQMDVRLDAFHAGVRVGYVNYAVFEERAHLSYVEVHPDYRRKKIATGLIRHLQERFPGKEIKWGMLSEDGAQLKKSLEFNVIEDFEVSQKIERRDALQRILNVWTNIVEDYETSPTPENKKRYQSINFSVWNTFNDELEDLNRELDSAVHCEKLVA